MDYGNAAIAVAYPLLTLWLDRRGILPGWCSPIILCYATGIVLANLPRYGIDGAFIESLAGGSMLLGLPLLLLAVNLRSAWQHARTMLMAYGLCCLAGLISTSVAAVVYLPSFPDGYKVAGMLTGLYTGGTPNVQAIGIALGAPANYLVLIQAADVLLGGAYLLGLLSFLPRLYSSLLPTTISSELVAKSDNSPDRTVSDANPPKHTLRSVTAFLLISIGIVGASASLSYLLTGSWTSPTLLVLLVTSLSLGLAATAPHLRAQLGNSYTVGEYFILVFCIGIGMLADFKLLLDQGVQLLAFSALALGLTTLLHLLVCICLRVDRDTVILSYVAAAYGPVFVAQVATSLRNTTVLAPAMAASLLGFGIGNYLGIGLGLALRALTG